MQYLLLNDFEDAEEIDDGIYLVQTRVTEESDPSESTKVPFSEGDLWHIRKKAPPEADGIALTDDWMFFNSSKNMLFEYVFKD